MGGHSKKLRILSDRQTPAVFHDNCIVSGYRSANAPYSEYLKSVFRLNNNETLNFWTHFIPFLFLLAYIVQFEKKHDAFYHPFLLYLSSVALSFFTSSIAHAFHSRSKVATHVFLIIDYIAISAFGVGACIAFKAYSLSLMPHEYATLFDYYITIAIAIAILMNIVTSSARFIMASGKRTFIKMSAVILPQVFNALPILLRLVISFSTSGENVNREGDYYYIAAYASAIACPIIYALHLPERFYPVTFDIIGQSHQWYHLCTLLAAYLPFRAIRVDMEQVRPFYDSIKSNQSNFYSSIDYIEFMKSTNIPYLDSEISYFHAICAFFVANAFIVIYYCIKATHFNPWDAIVHTIEDSYDSCCSTFQNGNGWKHAEEEQDDPATGKSSKLKTK